MLVCAKFNLSKMKLIVKLDVHILVKLLKMVNDTLL